MVQLLIDGLGGDRRRRPVKNSQEEIQCYHVNARLSGDVDDIGRVRAGKIPTLLRYCAEALWCRFRHGAKHFYYVPAPPQRAPLYRDWIVMALCRPFFARIIFHWHAVGLGEWLEQEARPFERWVTKKLLTRSDVSVVLGGFYAADIAKLSPKRIEAVPNGIPDPCPDYEASILPRRKARFAAREKLRRGESTAPHEGLAAAGDPHKFHLLYLSICMREKGLFDAIDAVAIANGKLAAQRSPLRIILTVAGKFFRETEQREFEKRIQMSDLKDAREGFSFVGYRGFVGGDEKNRLLRESDCLCLPSYYPAEGHPVTLLEAMAYGLPIIATKWRALPELFPQDYPLVEIKSPTQIAAVLEQFLARLPQQDFRRQFLDNFLQARFIERMKAALAKAERPDDKPVK